MSIVFAGGASAFSQAERPFRGLRAEIIPNRFIIVLREEVQDPRSVAQDMARYYGLTARHVYKRAIKGFSAFIPAERLAAVEGDPDVAFVEPDRRVYAVEQTLPSGVDRIDADLNGTGKIDGVDERVDVDIAIIDTGIDLDHPDLNVHRSTDCARWSFFGNPCRDGRGDDLGGHGTHVAGTAAAIDNGFGVVGVAPGARLWAVKALRSDGSGYLSWVISGIDWVTAHAGEIEVANMSLGWQGNSSAARMAIQESVGKGIVYVVAAGNNSGDVYGQDRTFGTGDDFEPASYPEVAAISALSDTDGKPGGGGPSSAYGPDDSFASFSNFSASLVSGNPVSSPGKAIDLLLPGVDIYSTYRGGGYAIGSGTSMASPHGAGLAALYIAANGRATNAAGVYAIRQGLIDAGVAQNSENGLNTLNDPDPNWENIGWAGPSGPVGNPPAVAITNPAAGSTVSGTVEVAADATDEDGVVRVEFFVDGRSIGVDSAGSDGWSISWNTTADTDGEHTLSATAMDNSGETASASISVTVDNIDDPPTVNITSPTDGATVSGTVEVTAQATDDGGVTQVEFLVDGGSMGVDSAGSDGWSASWNTTAEADGDHTVTATAMDTRGQTANASISVTVDNVDEQPTVGITSPGDGATVSGTVEITADAADDDDVTQVEFFVDGSSIGVDSVGSDGWSAYWDTTAEADGSHAVTATAMDTIGQTASASISVFVDNSSTPTTLHIGDLDGSSSMASFWMWRATVSVTVHDASHNPVSGAEVNGTWSGGYPRTDSCLTDSSGRCSITSGSLFVRRYSSVRFTVSGVTHAALAYKPSANHDPDGDSDGTSIVVIRP